MYSEPDYDHLLVDTVFTLTSTEVDITTPRVKVITVRDNNVTWVRRGAGARKMAVESIRKTKTTGCQNTEVISSSGSKDPFMFKVR
jgi:hypothetical protein